MRLIFNSSLPRSGSTLLQNLLQQNPRFYCSPTSGLVDLLYAARQQFTASDMFRLQDAGLMRKAWLGYCRGAALGFYSGITDKEIACEKSRAWMAYFGWLREFFPEAKVICCIRDIRAIVASMEKMRRRNSALHDPAENPAEMKLVTIEDRVRHWMGSPPVGLALNRLRDACMQGHDEHFFFVVYEDFMRDPKPVLERLYDFIGEPNFDHDLDHVTQLVSENDAVHGVYGDHKIRNGFGPLEPDYREIMGDPICNGLIAANKWFYRRFYPAGIDTPK